MRRADELLKLKRSAATTTATAKNDELSSVEDGPGPGIEELRPDILVLPEMAFTGYNFPSLQAIKPYLEPQGTGPTAKWARDTAKYLKCKVCVGYPEISKAEVRHGDGDEAPSPSETEKYFNSLLVVDENGEILLNYRKQFLYYTDETWASEGDGGWGYHALEFDSPRPSQDNATRQQVPTTFGICMDINPYRFEAPFTAWEFANRVLDSQSQLVIISTAWLTLEGQEAIASLGRNRPDMDTFNYWIRRFWPLIEKRMAHDGDIDGGSSLRSGMTQSEKKVVLVFANRTGVEEGTEGFNPTATYAGTSTIIAITQKLPPEKNGDGAAATGLKQHDNEKPLDVKILCWDMKGATEEGICFADTLSEPKMVFGLVKRSDDGNGDGNGDDDDDGES
ncbi:Uncharacterized protein T310_9667 [Rasamsonia emersonii CBS 393.64]|uniref:CN hydrolase domain-containing protein n=1 Tax=Rasamsonia emersonii (strain ATCC 16479 / CBS 393.64 / IMI 116815) TaxID=1408163 RepID=A0A0F4YGH2_RASE3|nr:Uncharacterized protein T310_9667 [Rasamsonia emersonii CBS 393.64]KKA16713.1 Uncharacterized protein T310_9667 [Rasamsonia emersonii CBS 393.64]